MVGTVSRRTLLTGVAGGIAALNLPGNALAKHAPTPGLVQLNFNENPYGPSPNALAAANDAAKHGAYYAGDILRELRTAIAERQGVDNSNVRLSTGSNEALCAAVAAWGKKGHVLAPALTYSAHLHYARRIGVAVRTVPMQDDMSIDLDAMAAAVDDDTALVYVCNPNNPTGLTIDGDELRDFCKRVGARAPVLVDEAYNELTAKPDYTSMMDLVHADENVVITRTFSKVYGLAGLRIGYALGRDDLIGLLGAHIMSWPNAIGLSAALASHQDRAFLDFAKQKIVDGRDIISKTFKRHGLRTLPSETNFVFADLGRDATEFAAQMRERNVVVGRTFQPYTTWSRVSTGRIEDVQAFARTFDEIFPE